MFEAKRDDLENLCRRRRVSKLSGFGSALGDDFGPRSDLDVLVEFEPGRTPGFEFARLQRDLSELFGLQVDLHTYRSLSRHFRDGIVRESRTLFDASVSRI